MKIKHMRKKILGFCVAACLAVGLTATACSQTQQADDADGGQSGAVVASAAANGADDGAQAAADDAGASASTASALAAATAGAATASAATADDGTASADDGGAVRASAGGTQVAADEGRPRTLADGEIYDDVVVNPSNKLSNVGAINGGGRLTATGLSSYAEEDGTLTIYLPGEDDMPETLSSNKNYYSVLDGTSYGTSKKTGDGIIALAALTNYANRVVGWYNVDTGDYIDVEGKSGGVATHGRPSRRERVLRRLHSPQLRLRHLGGFESARHRLHGRLRVHAPVRLQRAFQLVQHLHRPRSDGRRLERELA